MEILVGPGAMDYDPAPWPVFPMATPSVGTPRYSFAVSWQSSQLSPACSWGCTSWNAWIGVGWRPRRLCLRWNVLILCSV